MLSQITICPMSEEDLNDVLLIEAASFPHPWNRTHFLDELKSPHSFPLVAFDAGGRVAGYICAMQVLDEGHILDVAVRPDLRGCGIGRLLVEKVLGMCRQSGADYVSLEVRPSNLAAVELYRRMGFIVTGRRPRYYHDGEDALLMEFIFGDNEEEGDAV
ncbi:[SSU ribosomal protein S18P]-alanine acetyltransferase [Geobacter sp. DSM 9736]|nr:[SSU ribosomal protein S18P]-alanine acetyltransferase [Geobacter sp. DSM 9736]